MMPSEVVEEEEKESMSKKTAQWKLEKLLKVIYYYYSYELFICSHYSFSLQWNTGELGSI